MSNNWRKGRRLTFTYELIVFLCYAFTLYVDTNLERTAPVGSSFGGRFRYLTFWSFLIQIAYFFISSWRSFFNLSQPNKYWSLFAAGIVFPACMFVSVTFWVLYSIDREIIYPKVLDSIIPSWVNHVLHTYTVPVLITERCLTRVQYPNSKDGLIATILFSAIYFIWMIGVSFYNGVWVYPIYEVLSLPGKIVFTATCILLLAGFYFLGTFVNRLFWGNDSIGWNTVKSRMKKSK